MKWAQKPGTEKNSMYVEWIIDYMLCVCFTEEGAYTAVQAGLKLTLCSKLALNSKQPFCLSLPSAGIIGMNHHAS